MALGCHIRCTNHPRSVGCLSGDQEEIRRGIGDFLLCKRIKGGMRGASLQHALHSCEYLSAKTVSLIELSVERTDF